MGQLLHLLLLRLLLGQLVKQDVLQLEAVYAELAGGVQAGEVGVQSPVLVSLGAIISDTCGWLINMYVFQKIRPMVDYPSTDDIFLLPIFC